MAELGAPNMAWLGDWENDQTNSSVHARRVWPEVYYALTPAEKVQLWQAIARLDRLAHEEHLWQTEMLGDAAVMGRIDSLIAQHRAAFESSRAGQRLTQPQREALAPYLYGATDRFGLFRPVLHAADGVESLEFVPTVHLLRLQIRQALAVTIRGSGDEHSLIIRRSNRELSLPMSHEQSLAQFHVLGKTNPGQFMELNVASGGLESATADLAVLVPVGAVLSGSTNLVNLVFRATGEIAVNAVAWSAAEAVAQRHGPIGALSVELAPILFNILRRRLPSGPTANPNVSNVRLPRDGRVNVHSGGALHVPQRSVPQIRRAPAPDNYRGRYLAELHAQGRPRLPDDWDVHHRIPQEYMNHSQFGDFDFHHPSNLRGVRGSRASENVHQRITNEWADFRTQNPNATRSQIEEFANQIDERYAIEWWR